jgi:exonuclease SbcD
LQNGKSLARKTFNNVETAVEWLTENQNSLVELTLESETFLTAEERKRIYQTHHGIVHLIPKIRNQEFNENELRTVNLNQDIQSLFKDYFKSKNNGQEANEDLINLFNEIKNL